MYKYLSLDLRDLGDEHDISGIRADIAGEKAVWKVKFPYIQLQVTCTGIWVYDYHVLKKWSL